MKWYLLLGLIALTILVWLFFFMHTTTSLPESSRDLSLEDAVGQMLLIGFRGRDVGEDVEKILVDIKPGGVILFDRAPSDTDVGRNIESPEQVRALTKRLRLVTSTPQQ